MRYFVLLFALFVETEVFSQIIIEKPNFGNATHPTLSIEKIEITPVQTIVYMTVVNNSEKGDQFCADKNIYIQPSWLKTRYNLLRSENIPVCPDVHQFYGVGEQLSFKLVFPPIDTSLRYIDIVEDCNNSCFIFRGVILNKKFNDEVNLAFSRYERGDLSLAAICYENIIEWFPDYPFGFAYFHLVGIYAELDNWEKAKFWYSAFKKSDAIFDLQILDDALKMQSYYAKLK